MVINDKDSRIEMEAFIYEEKKVKKKSITFLFTRKFYKLLTKPRILFREKPVEATEVCLVVSLSSSL